MLRAFYLFLYISLIALANYTAANILELPFGINLAIGTIFFGFVFTVRDKLHQYGRKTVYTGIMIASIVSLLLNYYLQAPSQIILASVIGLVLGEIADTEVFARVKNNWLVKSLSSNAVSVPLDTVLFNVIAFVGTDLATSIPGLIVGDIIFKVMFSSALAFGYWFLNKKKRRINNIQ